MPDNDVNNDTTLMRRGPGRPRQRQEPSELIRAFIPVSLAEALDAASGGRGNRTAYVIRALREQIARDQYERERP